MQMLMTVKSHLTVSSLSQYFSVIKTDGLLHTQHAAHKGYQATGMFVMALAFPDAIRVHLFQK
jgi:predicted phage gp36 major capsid-like protein